MSNYIITIERVCFSFAFTFLWFPCVLLYFFDLLTYSPSLALRGGDKTTHIQGAAILSHMRLEPASRGAVLLRLPSRIRGLVIVELKPSLLAATMAGLEPSDVATLLGSLDATDGDRFKAFSLFHDGFAGQLLRALTATERADLMAGMRIKEQSRVLALMTPSERGMSLKALPMEVQVALLGAMTEADRREAL